MFNTQCGHQNYKENERILKVKWQELHDKKQSIEKRLLAEENETPSKSKSKAKKPNELRDITAKMNVLSNAAQQMGFCIADTDPSCTTERDTLSLSETDISSESSFAEQEVDNALNESITPCTPLPKSHRNTGKPIHKIQASNHNVDVHRHVFQLLRDYERETQIMSDRIKKRNPTAPMPRIYHVNPHSMRAPNAQYLRTESTPLSEYLGTYVEHYCVNTIDEALATYVDGDIIELCEGIHCVKGEYRIYGALTIRGGTGGLNTNNSNMNKRYVIEGSHPANEQFLWLVGRTSKILFENLTIRSTGFC